MEDNFNPHLPYGRWPVANGQEVIYEPISIHTFLTEGDPGSVRNRSGKSISIHTFLTEGDYCFKTLSSTSVISIHTFLTEGDFSLGGIAFKCFISIHTFLTEGDAHKQSWCIGIRISIHTFLTEGDGISVPTISWKVYFNPHLPYGRWLDGAEIAAEVMHFNPHLPYGRWRIAGVPQKYAILFQSTPSLRKVTHGRWKTFLYAINFNPHLPYGRWLAIHFPDTT